MVSQDKPTVKDLGVELDRVVWRSSGGGHESIQVAFVEAHGQRWALMRGGPSEHVSLFTRHEWECFIDGARNGEFDDAT